MRDLEQTHCYVNCANGAVVSRDEFDAAERVGDEPRATTAGSAA
jgi:hypothetical protein